jgi:glycosyltransferase involved in cell wall biosynthesis
MSKRLALIIPAYNEEKAIAPLILQIHAELAVPGFVIDPVVVNDASKDRTASIARELPCILLNLPVNLGIGGAVQTGFQYAWKNGYDYAMQMDGDGQHPPAEVSKLVTAMINSDADVVIGSRFLEKEGFQSTFLRRLGITYFKTLIKVITGIRITDCTSGFRIYNRKALENVAKSYPDEYPEPESFIIFKKNQLKVKEVPVIMIERQGGKSSINSFHSVYFVLKVTLATLFASLK